MRQKGNEENSYTLQAARQRQKGTRNKAMRKNSRTLHAARCKPKAKRKRGIRTNQESRHKNKKASGKTKSGKRETIRRGG
jgi:hypothetical protein